MTEVTINDKGPSILHANITWCKRGGEWSFKKRVCPISVVSHSCSFFIAVMSIWQLQIVISVANQ